MQINRALSLFVVTAGLFLLLGIVDTRASRPPVNNAQSPSGVVLVELFTSEGCSSCPPADSLLKQLSEEPSIPGVEVIALEEHVDYWDHLGWKDPYSSSIFTERQNDYARLFHTNGAYTPQMVVDGQAEFVGNRSREVLQAIQKAAAGPKLMITLVSSLGSAGPKVGFDIKIANLAALPTGKEAELWVAITERNLHTDVKAGENSGERWQHAAVVRSIRKVSSFRGPSDYVAKSDMKLDRSWEGANLNFVAFAVEKSSRKIVGAATAKLSQPN